MKVWRIHIKNDVAPGYSREDLLDFCLKEKLIGVGWGEIKTRVNDESIIRKQAQFYSEPTPAIKALNAMRKIQVNDLIWTRLGNRYFLCRVIGLWTDSKPTPKHYELDIPNYVNVEWLEIGMEKDVPGKVVSSFRPAATAQAVNGVTDISQYIWNKYSGKDTYLVEKEKLDFWSVLSAEAIEELVLLYLQVEKEYYIHSSTVKNSFPTYECELVNKSGIRAYPQVKSGGESLKADDYMEAINYNPKAEVYLFSTSESYTKNNCKQVHFLYKRDIDTFIKKNKELMFNLTNNWLELCGFFDK